MDPERRLREHLDTVAARLPEPHDSYDHVVRRGRRRRVAVTSAVSVASVVALLAVPVTLRSLDRTTITFDPAEQPPATTPATEATASPTASPTPTSAPAAAPIDVGELGAPVLAYGPFDHSRLALIDGEDEQLLVSRPVDVALPAGDGQVVYQPASTPELHWVSTAENVARPWRNEHPQQLLLRAVLPDGRVVYSVRPQDGEEVDDRATEEFFTLAPVEDATPEPFGTRPAYESWTLGPAVAADGDLVAGACHLHCALRPWRRLAEPALDYEDPLYDGRAIEGLTSTPDGRVIGFVEFDHVLLESGQLPQLVLLDGASFAELARLDLPLAPGASPGGSTVSLSADGQRVLVSMGAADAPTTRPYLVRRALTRQPRVVPVDFEGTVRWFDPGS